MTSFFPQRSNESSLDSMEDTQDVSSDDFGRALAAPAHHKKKGRALSDTPPVQLPSPKLGELASSSKDDISVMPTAIQTPRPSLSTRGLSLQLPPYGSPLPNALPPSRRAPLSPKLGPTLTYGSPASVLPRRSRGLDFSRACTNLHHSTLADSSPESSPILAARGIGTPSGRSSQGGWGTLGPVSHSYQSGWSGHGHGERASMASSIGSVNMLASGSDESSSDPDEDMDALDHEDPIVMTPQVNKMFGDPAFGKPTGATNNAASFSPGSDWMGGHAPAARSLLNFRRPRSTARRPRKESSSASLSGGSSMPSPGAASPAAMRGVEGPYVHPSCDWLGNVHHSRRVSLTIGTSDLHLSSGAESDEGGPTVAGTPREKRGVVKRAVTRRGNLLPKTKNFARIKAALMEEGAPVDSDVRREAEVVRQVLERDADQPLTQGAQSPSLVWPMTSATALGLQDALESESGDDMTRGDAMARSLDRFPSQTFNVQAKRLSGGKEFWENFDPRTRTPPPPPPTFPRAGSLAASDDTSMDSPTTGAVPITIPEQHHAVAFDLSIKSSRSSQSSSTYHNPHPHHPHSHHPHNPQNHNQPPTYMQPSAEEITQRIRRKRERDDDFDPLSFKRRAVSPGVSVQNSPVLSESPIQRDSGWWGLPVVGAASRDPWPTLSLHHTAGTASIIGLGNGAGIGAGNGGGSGPGNGPGNGNGHTTGPGSGNGIGNGTGPGTATGTSNNNGPITGAISSSSSTTKQANPSNPNNPSNPSGGRASSITSSSTTSSSVKRVGFHGMNDTNDGLHKMSIE